MLVLGDPETQVILPRMKSDLVDVMEQVLEGKEVEISWDEQAMIGVVVAANGYPEEYEKGAILHGLDDVSKEAICFSCWNAKRNYR